MAIILRADKGSELTHSEMDTNFSELDKIPSGKVFPKTEGVGIKIDTDAPDWGWHDLVGQIYLAAAGTPAEYITYRGGIRALQFDESDEAFIDFHIPHDYVPGSHIYIHTHWSHDSAIVTGGSVTWGFEMMYAKGHQQAAFPAPVTPSAVQNADTTQYWHHIAEVQASTTGGSGVAIDTSLIEVDGIMQVRVYLDSNDITTSGGLVKPFLHFVDIHYQSTNLATKNKAPDFWV
jgi:hypothetical protein